MASALYLHIPFCARKCAYCDFASWAIASGDGLPGAYCAALVRQHDEAVGLGLLEGCETAYVGGGTPTVLDPAELGWLVGSVARASRPIELTCEANPDSLTDGHIDALRAAGATRLSIGVQSLDDRELLELGRLHDADRACERVSAAVASGLDVSVDLMCAIPWQSERSWARTLRGVMGLGVGHVSVYPLQIEEGTALERRYADDPCPWNDSSVQAARMEQARDLLEGYGFKRYEVASYARAGKACIHNKAYWTGRTYLGLGTGASSMLDLTAYLSLKVVCPRLPDPPSGTTRVRLTVDSSRGEIAREPSLSALSFSLEFLDEPQSIAEDLMLAARLVEGIAPGLAKRARAVLGRGFDAAAEDLLSRGLLVERSGRLAPTELGWLLGNELYGALWGLAPGQVASARA